MSSLHSPVFNIYITIPENLSLGSARVWVVNYISFSKTCFFLPTMCEKNMDSVKKINLRGKLVSTLKKHILSTLKGCN